MSKIDSDRLKVEYLSPHDLRSNLGNAKIHPKRQIDKIVKSIRRFGFVNPVLISDDMEVVAGHGRVEAAKHLRLEHVPVVRLSGLTTAERLAYTLADNRLAEFGRYDRQQLAIQLEQLTHLAFADVEVTGFSLGDVDIRLERRVEESGHPVGPDDALPAPERRIVSRRGDRWKLGGHCLLCGDASSATDVQRLMDGQQAEGVFLDPRRNLGTSARSELEITEALSSSLRLAKGVSKPGTIIFVFLSGLNYEVFTAVRAEQLPLETVVVWAKRDAGVGGLYRSQHELIAVLKNGDAADLSSFSVAQHGRRRSNLWKYGEGAPLAGHDGTSSMHLTCRPVALLANAIRDVSGKGAIVLDTFAGTGSTLIAAEKTGRRAYLLEVEPACCDLILRRFHHNTGQAAELDGEGLTFGDVEKSRLADRTSLSIHNDERGCSGT